MKTTTDTTKITAKVWRPAVDKLNRKLHKACLRRDAYLTRVLEVEIPELDAEVSLPNTPEAERYVASKLAAFDLKPVSMALPVSLVEQLNDICRRKRIVRDAFFNRLFLLLAAEPAEIDELYWVDDENWRGQIWAEYKHEDPFFHNVFYPLEQEIDPLWPMREALRLRAEDMGTEDWTNPDTGETIRVQRSMSGDIEPVNSLYTGPFYRLLPNGCNLIAFSTYLAERDLPGSAGEQRYEDAFAGHLIPLERPQA